jgi:predicted CXXCH cytochrome family protein
MLRQVEGAGSFCSQCHEQSSSSKANIHASGIDQAHLRKSPKTAAAAAASGRVDDESRACMSCHDGAAAADAGAHSAMRGLVAFGAQEHPIGIVYPTSPSSCDSQARLVDPRSLDGRIRLFNQTVGCGSCHSVYSSQNSLVVMSNQRSRLCLSCHIE